MDPNAALAAIRTAVQDLDNVKTDDDVIDVAHKLAEHARALDEWLVKGGFLPTSWDRQSRIWTLNEKAAQDLAADASGARTFRLSVDWGELKWKRDEEMWTAGRMQDR